MRFTETYVCIWNTTDVDSACFSCTITHENYTEIDVQNRFTRKDNTREFTRRTLPYVYSLYRPYIYACMRSFSLWDINATVEPA